jgi:hypothetical protein
MPYALPGKDTGTSTTTNENPKTGTGLFLDEVFSFNRKASKILRLNRKIFDSQIQEAAVSLDVSFKHLAHVNTDFTLINYYRGGEEYKSHHDFAVLSTITMLEVGPIDGGDLHFPEYDAVVKFKHNRCILFPSCAKHHAQPANKATDGVRISIAQFLNYVPKNKQQNNG